MTWDEHADPRITGERVRRIEGSGGTVTLVGAVHDHPASAYRARTLACEVDPAVLALELSPLAVPLYESHADDSRTPPAFGGEMSAAIQAASTDHVVGIDGPSRRFVRRLLRRLLEERASRGTIRTVGQGLLDATKRSVTCRAAAGIARRTGWTLAVDESTDFDRLRIEPPAMQASDERDRIERAQAVLDALEPSRAARYRDESREAHMADRLSDLRTRGSVVAVVGLAHLDPIADRLTTA